jgi:hypothetical protein
VIDYLRYEYKRNVKKGETALKYELRRCEVMAMDKIAEVLKYMPDGIIVKYCAGMLMN